MKTRLILYVTCILLFSANAFAQTAGSQDALTYRIEAFGSAATGDYTPFWLVNNHYGVVPSEAGNGYLKPGVFYNQSFGKGFYWNAGLELVASVPRYRNVYVQQLYAEIGYKSLLVSIGSRERYSSLWDRQLSSGDMVLSGNARPIPELNLSMPAYTVVPLTKGWMQIKGDFAIGRSFDQAYLEQFANEKQAYNKNTLWHHKSFHVRIKDTRNKFPLSVEIGVQHWAQWGGTSTNPEIGTQPHSLKDFVRVVFGKEGGDGATASDSINVLGNHYGSYDFRVGFTRENWAAHAYHQHYFEDKSGMIFNNSYDGLWGLQVDLPVLPWLNKVVVEHLETRHQTGPMHFLFFDHEKYPGIGGGADDYYNNGEYTTGTSYFNRSLGSPFLLSPEYNTDGSLGFKSSRVRAWHVGISGELSSAVKYRLLVSNSVGWGRPYQPFLNTKESNSAMIEITYCHPRLEGWQFTGTLAGNTGDFPEKSFGFGLSASKRGLLTK